MKWNSRKTFAGLVSSWLLVAACQASEPVNINLADAKTIAERLTGIGPVKAQAIVDYRDLNGQFENAEQLQMVEGIGESLFSQVKPYLLIEQDQKSDSSGTQENSTEQDRQS